MPTNRPWPHTALALHFCVTVWLNEYSESREQGLNHESAIRFAQESVSESIGALDSADIKLLLFGRIPTHKAIERVVCSVMERRVAS